MGKTLCFKSAKQFNAFMHKMSDVYSVRGTDGNLRWFSNSTKSKHIATMVETQRPPRDQRQNSPLKTKLFHNSTRRCYYNDNYLYKKKRNYKSDSSLNKIKPSHNSAFFYNYELIGDDFFLDVANLDLENNATKTGFKGRPIRNCGLCISGQTIRDVTALVKTNVKLNDYIVSNVGSVDLLQGRDSNEMRKDFVDLYTELNNRGIHAFITTVAPLANMLFSEEIQKRWQQFNMFLLNKYPNVVDITCCFVSNTNRVLFECYQPTPKYVSGCKPAHLLWNFVGRQRVLKHLKNGIAELTYRNSFFNDNF